MNTSIESESHIINNKEFTILGINDSMGKIGICNTTLNHDKEIKETFFVGHDALINVTQKSVNDKFSNKIIQQLSSIEPGGDFSRRIALSCTEYFENNQSVTAALQPILERLKNGLYVVYENEMLPTDGGGNFFWSSYIMRHEFGGSSTFNAVCKLDYNLPPAFLVPTEGIITFSDKTLKKAIEKVKNDDEAVGICFHLTGMFCALLSNHHEVTAALMLNKKVRCLVIEPVRYILSSNDFEHEKKPDEAENEKFLYTCCAKIPLKKISHPLLETFFSTRFCELGKNADAVTYNSERPSRMRNRKSLPREIIEKCDKMPDFEMLQSAAMIGYLSDDEINALLQGETMLNDEYIINKNYYTSITIALSYLQYKDFNKFLEFSVNILRNEDLTAVHQYVATRLQPIMNEKISNLFNELLKSENPVYGPIKALAERYIKRYKAHIDAPPEKIRKSPEASLQPEKRSLKDEIDALIKVKNAETFKK